MGVDLYWKLEWAFLKDPSLSHFVPLLFCLLHSGLHIHLKEKLAGSVLAGKKSLCGIMKCLLV